MTSRTASPGRIVLCKRDGLWQIAEEWTDHSFLPGLYATRSTPTAWPDTTPAANVIAAMKARHPGARVVTL